MIIIPYILSYKNVPCDVSNSFLCNFIPTIILFAVEGNFFGCIFPLVLEMLLCYYKSSRGNFPCIIFYPVPWKIPYGIG